MKKNEILRNLATATIPICAVVFLAGWFIFRNVVGAAILPIVLLVASIYSNIGKYYEDIKRDIAGITKKKYKATKAYELIAPNDSVDPSLCMEIEDDKYLLTNGQWIFDDEIYGENASNYYDEDSDIFNCYSFPYSFPSTEFELWISKLDGRPIRIVVLGEYLAPEIVNWPTPEKYCEDNHVVIDRTEVDTARNA